MQGKLEYFMIHFCAEHPNVECHPIYLDSAFILIMSSRGFPRACAFDKNRLTCHSLVKSNFSKLGQGLAKNVSEHLCKKKPWKQQKKCAPKRKFLNEKLNHNDSDDFRHRNIDFESQILAYLTSHHYVYWQTKYFPLSFFDFLPNTYLIL